MRIVACGLVVMFLLAGCSNGEPAKTPIEASTNFEDLDVEATETTGILIGVVVDEAIRPLPGATVGVTGATTGLLEQVTDDLGRFAFDDLEPGTYFVVARLLNYGDAQTAADVVAGDEEPPAVRLQLTRLFNQEPFTQQIKYDGFLACAYAIGVSSTCVNDYTRVTGTQCIPSQVPPPYGGSCYCQGGCLRDQNMAARGGNIREYVSSVGPGWQVIIWEETWKPTSDAGKNLGFTVSFFSRPTASHIFASANGPAPLRLEYNVGEKHSTARTQAGTPEMIPAEGYNETFTFFGAGTDNVVLNQQFTSFETQFYFGLPPPGWSFVKGNPLPF